MENDYGCGLVEGLDIFGNGDTGAGIAQEMRF